MVMQQWEPFVEYGLQQVVVNLFKNRKEGRLACRSGERHIGFIWAEGTIQGAFGNQVDRFLVELLLKREFFTRDQFSRLLQGFDHQQPLRDNLLQSGVLTGHELTGVETELLLEALAGVLVWRTGEYAWESASFSPQGSQSPLVFCVDFVRAMLRFEDRLWLGERFGDLKVHGRLMNKSQLGVTTCDELEMLAGVPELLDGSRTLRQLVVASGLEEFFLLKCLHAWHLLGFLKLERQPSLRETEPLPRLVNEFRAPRRTEPEARRNRFPRENFDAGLLDEPTPPLAKTVSLPRRSEAFDPEAVPPRHSLASLETPKPISFEERSAIAEPRSVKESKGSRWLYIALAVFLVVVLWFWQPWQLVVFGDDLTISDTASSRTAAAQHDQPTVTIEEAAVSPARESVDPEPDLVGDAVGEPESKSLVLAQGKPDQLWHRGLYQQAAEAWRNRLATQPDGFTLGLFMACDLENIDDVVNRYGTEPLLYILPRAYQGQACYWVCWGQFSDRTAAQHEIGQIPADIMAEKRSVRAYPISFIVR